MKHRIGFGLYTTYGSINCQLAEKTGFTDADAEVMKEALRTLFENDVSSARPEGSMEVLLSLIHIFARAVVEVAEPVAGADTCAPLHWAVVFTSCCLSTPFLWCLPKETGADAPHTGREF